MGIDEAMTIAISEKQDGIPRRPIRWIGNVRRYYCTVSGGSDNVVGSGYSLLASSWISPLALPSCRCPAMQHSDGALEVIIAMGHQSNGQQQVLNWPGSNMEREKHTDAGNQRLA